MIAKQRFDRQFFRDLGKLLRPYWGSEEKWIAYLLLLLVIVCAVVQVRIGIAMNEFSRDFYNALQAFDKVTMVKLMVHFGFLLAALILAVGYNVYFSGLLIIRWRRWLTQNYLQSWLDKQAYYRLQVFAKNVDNPDQRINEDLDLFPTTTVSLFISLFTSILTIIWFGTVLWNLSGSMILPLWNNYQINVHGYLFWLALGYAVLGTWLTKIVGAKLATLNYRQQQFNANFRFNLVRVRESSEQIALSRGEQNENTKFHGLFTNIFDNYVNMIKVQKRLMFFTNGYNMIAFIAGLTAGMPLYFAKKIQIGGMMQISGAFSEVIGALSILVNAFATLANWRAVVYRLTEFNQSVDKVSQPDTWQTIQIKQHAIDSILVKHLDILLPDGTLLLPNINLELTVGDSLLISGEVGTGKSTLLRAIAGIWPYGRGEIILPLHKNLFFIPQKPYMPVSSLRAVLTYPTEVLVFTDDELIVTLKQCGLEKLQSRLDEIQNWAQELSLGEQQLISFARIFLHKPDYVFLDETTSALDETMEAKMYQYLRQHLPNLTIVSVGHRNTLSAMHQRKLELTAQKPLTWVQAASRGSL